MREGERDKVLHMDPLVVLNSDKSNLTMTDGELGLQTNEEEVFTFDISGVQVNAELNEGANADEPREFFLFVF